MVCQRLTASSFVHRLERCGPVMLGGGDGVPFCLIASSLVDWLERCAPVTLGGRGVHERLTASSSVQRIRGLCSNDTWGRMRCT